jgi:hypothetical protein
MTLKTALIMIVVIGSILYALFVSGILKARKPQIIQTNPQTTIPTTNATKNWVPGLQVFAGIVGVILCIWLLSWYFDGKKTQDLEIGQVYEIEVDLGRGIRASSNKPYYASKDKVKWYEVGGTEKPDDYFDFGNLSHYYYKMKYEGTTVVTVVK